MFQRGRRKTNHWKRQKIAIFCVKCEIIVCLWPLRHPVLQEAQSGFGRGSPSQNSALQGKPLSACPPAGTEAAIMVLGRDSNPVMKVEGWFNRGSRALNAMWIVTKKRPDNKTARRSWDIYSESYTQNLLSLNRNTCVTFSVPHII